MLIQKCEVINLFYSKNWISKTNMRTHRLEGAFKFKLIFPKALSKFLRTFYSSSQSNRTSKSIMAKSLARWLNTQIMPDTSSWMISNQEFEWLTTRRKSFLIWCSKMCSLPTMKADLISCWRRHSTQMTTKSGTSKTDWCFLSKIDLAWEMCLNLQKPGF